MGDSESVFNAEKQRGGEAEKNRNAKNLCHSASPLLLCDKNKTLYDTDGIPIAAGHINGYLMDGPDVWVESRTKPICDASPLVFGSMPNDGGFFSDWVVNGKVQLLQGIQAVHYRARKTRKDLNYETI